jgi:hypothetical protein
LFLDINLNVQSIRKWQFYFFILSMVLIFYLCLRGDRWFPLLDSANLAFHEFGHPFFGAFSQRLEVYGGTLGQLVFPISVILYFYRRADTFQMSIGVLWTAQNFFNIATYMRDARAQLLPLVGGGEHDWTEIFTRWGCLQSDMKISDHLIKLVVLALFGFTYWLFQKIDE